MPPVTIQEFVNTSNRLNGLEDVNLPMPGTAEFLLSFERTLQELGWDFKVVGGNLVAEVYHFTPNLIVKMSITISTQLAEPYMLMIALQPMRQHVGTIGFSSFSDNSVIVSFGTPEPPAVPKRLSEIQSTPVRELIRQMLENGESIQTLDHDNTWLEDWTS